MTGAGCNTNTKTDSVTSGVVHDTVQETITYGTDASPQAIAEAQADCAEKGGEFTECASNCPEGEICAQVCVIACEFN